MHITACPLLYDDQELSDDLNGNIPELTLRFIYETGRFDKELLKLQLCTKQQPSRGDRGKL